MARHDKAEIEELLRSGQLEQANTATTALLQERPGDADGLCFLGRVLAARGDAEGALASFERALELQPEHADARAYRGSVLASLGHDDEARLLFEGVLATAPEHPAAHFGVARLLAKQDKFQDARAHIERALAAEPDNALFHLGHARVLLDLEELPEAFEALKRTVQANPHLLEGWHMIARLQLVFGEPKDAAANLQEALRLNPGELTLLEAYANAGLLAGDVAGAVRAAEDVVAARPDLMDPRVNLALCLLAGERFADAERVLREALAKDPSHVRALLSLASLLERVERDDAVDEAVTLYERASELAPERFEPYNDLGLMLLDHERLKDPERAVKLLTTAVEKAGEGAAEPLLNLAIAHARQGRSDEARAALRRLAAHGAADAELKARGEELSQLLG